MLPLLLAFLISTEVDFAWGKLHAASTPLASVDWRQFEPVEPGLGISALFFRFLVDAVTTLLGFLVSPGVDFTRDKLCAASCSFDTVVAALSNFRHLISSCSESKN